MRRPTRRKLGIPRVIHRAWMGEGPTEAEMVEAKPSESRLPQPRLHQVLRAGVILLSLLSALLFTGCGSLSGGRSPFSGGEAGAESIAIRVQNLNFNDATLHALSSGKRYRMGTVSGKSEETFEVPWQSQEELRVEIDLLAGRDHVTNGVSLAPGDRAQLYIQPVLRRSHLQP